MKKEPIKYFSMFSGIGGFELGLENSKYEFENIGYSEVDKYASSIYTRHFPKHKAFGDATQINTEELNDFSILLGGFPCQTFSIAGKRAGFNDTRGTLFFELARVLSDKQPPYFLFENVKGLLSHEGGRTFQRILEVLNECGYDVSWKIYNSKFYGVPQNRERLFIKGYSRTQCGQQILSIGRANGQTDSERRPNTPRISNRYIGVRTGRLHKPDELMNALSTTGQNCGSRQILRIGQIRNGQGGLVYDSNAISPCLCGEDAIKNGGINIKNPENLYRRLTPIESERLQGFPDNWTQYGKDGEIISDTQRYKCIGNAVTTTVVTAIINEMFDGINNNDT